jgi:hypothetical protein
MCFGPVPGTVEEKREHFEKCLRNAIIGSGDWPSYRGCGSFLSEQTARALERVESASPDPDPALVAAAREVFERQLDGTHAAQTKAEWDEWLRRY